MRTNWKLGSMLLLAAAGLMLVGAPGRVEARPQYLKQFNEKYPDLKEEIGKLADKCSVCHYGKGENAKKNRNNYAKDMSEALNGVKNEKDTAKIKEAIEGVESKKSATEGKSYKDLIDAGQLPSSGWKQPDSN